MAQSLSEKQKLIVAAGVGVALVGVMLYLTVTARTQIQQARNDIAQFQKQSKDAKQRISEIPALKQKEFQLSNAVNEYVKILPTEKEVNALYDTLNDLKDTAGVMLSGLKLSSGSAASQKKMSANFQMHTRDTKVSGPFFKVCTFINLLERYKRFMRVEVIGMKPIGEGGQVQLDAALRFSTFTYQPKVTKAAPAASKAKKKA